MECKTIQNKVLDQITAKTRELQEVLSTIDRRTAIPAFLIISYASLDRDIVTKCMNDNQEYKIEDNDSQFFDVLYNQFNLGFDNELPILGKHKIDDMGLQLFNIGKKVGLAFSPEEEQACLNYAMTNKQ